MFLPEVKRELIRVAIGVAVLGIVMILIFAVFGYFNQEVILGTLAGCIASFLNFTFLGWSVQRAIDKSETKAKAYMGSTYVLRLLLIGVFVVLMIKLQYFNYIAAVIPLIFPQIVIMILNIRRKDVNRS